MAESPARPSPRQRLLRATAFSALGGLAAAAALAVLPPANRPIVPVDAETRGAAFEQALAAAITKVRDPAGETWAIAIDPADINAWLATRLPRWIAHDPTLAELEPLVGIRVATGSGTLFIESEVGPLVATLPIAVELGAGGVKPSIGTARLGRLPLPGLARILGGAELELRIAEAAVLLRAAESDNAAIPLSDGRRVRLADIALREGAIELAFETTLGAARP